MAVSLGDALGIAEVAFNLRVWRLCKMCPCIGQTACFKQ